MTEAGDDLDGISVRDVEVESYSVSLPGTLTLPRENPRAVVVFAHGSGSSRLSPRNAYVATVLHESGFGTLLFDLLTGQEDAVYDNRFDIDLLAERLTAATEWLREQEGLADLHVGYFGASTGAAAALQASVRRQDVRAIVSRGGRPGPRLGLPRPRGCAHPPHGRREGRQGRLGVQRAGSCTAEPRRQEEGQRAGHHPGSDAPLRRTRSARRGRENRDAVVPEVPPMKPRRFQRLETPIGDLEDLRSR